MVLITLRNKLSSLNKKRSAILILGSIVVIGLIFLAVQSRQSQQDLEEMTDEQRVEQHIRDSQMNYTNFKQLSEEELKQQLENSE